MLENFAALDAIDRYHTTAAAGTALRISQSAISKRVAALEARMGITVVERRGRGIEITQAGRRLLVRVRPLLAELRDIVSAVHDEDGGLGKLPIGVSESVLYCWGADVLKQASVGVSGRQLEIHTHRSPVVVDRVRSGEYLLGLCAGIAESAPDLAIRPVLHEPMVLIPSGLKPLQKTKGLAVITIEEHAATWQSIHRSVKTAGLQVESTVESFAAIARMATSGFGHGLVPKGVATAMGLKPKDYKVLKMTRPVSVVGRATYVSRPKVAAFIDSIETGAQSLQKI
ncbi:MAG: LysR family transcriptional regulator [Gemmatimonadetes bacterium]|nr:LysR family transcriptional regulator [Gemmatimonadota bacterium]